MDDQYDSRNYSSSKNNEDFNLFIFVNLFKRNKTLISIFTIVVFLISCFNFFTKKIVWEGVFQIVVKNSENSRKSLDSFFSEGIGLNIGGQGNALKTEIGILESPSVLMPVFEYVRDEKNKKSKKTKKIIFNNWKKNNLQLKLKKETRILNISYQDTDKDIIIPVLRKIKNAYQEYSLSNKKRNIEVTKKYNEEQVKIYRTKASNSIRDAQEYALEQDLTILAINSPYLRYSSSPEVEGVKSFSNLFRENNSLSSTNDPLGDITSVELSRVEASNEIRNLDIKIKKIENLNENSEEFKYVIDSMPTLESSEISDNLSDLDLKLSYLKTKFSENYEPILRIENEKRLLSGILKKRVIGLLKAKKIQAEARLETAMRPKGVLLKYKELIRKAKRDETTLVKLEDNMRDIQLIESRFEDPWKLITNPTLNNIPVSQKRLLKTITYTFLGFLVSLLFAFFKERRSGKIYDKYILSQLLGAKIIDTFQISSLNNNDNKYLLFKDIINSINKNNINILFSNEISSSQKEDIINYFKENMNGDYSFSDKFSDINDKEAIVLVSSLNKISYSQVEKIKQSLYLLNRDLFGILILEN